MAQTGVLFAGGGTGGHLYPSLAVAERLGEMQPAMGRFFACSNRAIDRGILEKAVVAFEPLNVQPLPRRPWEVPGFLASYMASVRQARRLIQRENIGVVVAMGGFVCGPVAAAAKKLGVPVVLVNLDAVPGKANRWLVKRCDRIYSVYPVSDLGPDVRIVPLPLRRSALKSGDVAADRRALGLEPDRPVLLVTGASQGAGSLNQLMTELLFRPQIRKELEAWQVLHLCGSGQEADLERAYERVAVPAKVMGFCHEMGRAWGGAELAISRAGASSVAEAVANAVPTVFFPYPYHKDQHQKLNAQPWVDRGGAVLAEDHIDAKQNAARHLHLITQLLQSASRRQAMRRILDEQAPGDGADLLAQAVLEMCGAASGQPL